MIFKRSPHPLPATPIISICKILRFAPDGIATGVVAFLIVNKSKILCVKLGKTAIN